MKNKIVFIHTISGLVETFNKLGAELTPAAGLCHISDESLIQRVLAAGGPTPAVYHRICEHVVAAEQHGASVIQLTCSSVSPCVDVAKRLVSVPVLKIDEPMVERAVAGFKRIGVIATAFTTLQPTTELVREKASLAGRDVTLESILCAGAYDALLGGDLPRHDEIVRHHLLDMMAKVEVVLLAQASMARVANALEEKERTVPILSSPRPAVEHLAALLREGGSSG